MSEILAFIKTHRRDIIITAAALAASLVVMLLIPALIDRKSTRLNSSHT